MLRSGIKLAASLRVFAGPCKANQPIQPICPRTLAKSRERLYSAAMSADFVLAHLSDIHLGPLPRLDARYWNAKRLLGYINWHKNRKQAHLRTTLDRIVSDLAAQRPDHIAVTGDLANIGLPAEYEMGLHWLQSLGPPGHVTVVPGNHDIYTTLRHDPGHNRWRDYMAPIPASKAAKSTTATFPFVRRFGDIAIVATNSAIQTRPFYAGGQLGSSQQDFLSRHLEDLGSTGAFRVVLIHHPPLPGQAVRHKALADADALEHILCEKGAELVLHGHNHRSMTTYRRGPQGPFPVVGVGSASLGQPHNSEDLARYHLYRISLNGRNRTIELIVRGLSKPDGSVVEIERRLLFPTANLD